MFPFAHSCDDFPPDAEMLMEAALGVAKAMRAGHGQTYQTGQACELTFRSVVMLRPKV
jgi:extracellular matrix protein 14